MKIIIATIKEWNIVRARRLKEQYQGIHEVLIVTQKEELTYEAVCQFAPDYILLPHWSYYIVPQITDQWECVVFHMTDLPYGRGGSPLQNLIVRGHKETKISAIKVTEVLDGGPIYMKKPLSLEGSAHEIFERCADIIFEEMIPCFLKEKIIPIPQEGEPVLFRRRNRRKESCFLKCRLKRSMIISECWTQKGIRAHFWTMDHIGCVLKLHSLQRMEAHLRQK